MTAATKQRAGFTLVELLVVLGVVGILFAVILIAVDPARRFAEARNAIRRQDVRTILEAIIEYTADNRGNFPVGLDSIVASYQVIGTMPSGCNITCGYNPTVSVCLDLGASLIDTYLAEMPHDPVGGEDYNTNYYVNKTAGNRIVVGACIPELDETIRVMR